MLRDWAPALLIGLAVTAMVCGHKHFFAETSSPEELSTPPIIQPAEIDAVGRLEYPIAGIGSPKLWDAADVEIADDAELIGICATGSARAYLLEAMSGSPDVHIINDLFEDLPITITHFDITGCTRVFTGERVRVPLNFSCMGLHYGGCIIHIDGRNYSQSTKRSTESRGGKIPNPEFPYTRTTWKRWLADHPDTKVYIGRVRPEMSSQTCR